MLNAVDGLLSLQQRRPRTVVPDTSATRTADPPSLDVERTAPPMSLAPVIVLALGLWFAHGLGVVETFRAGICATLIVWALFICNHDAGASAHEAKVRFALGLLPLLAWCAWWWLGRGLGSRTAVSSFVTMVLGAPALLLWLGKRTPGFTHERGRHVDGRIQQKVPERH